MARATVLKRFELRPETAAELERLAQGHPSQTACIHVLIHTAEIARAQAYGSGLQDRVGEALDLIMSDEFEAGTEILAELAGRDKSALAAWRSAKSIPVDEFARTPADVQTDSKLSVKEKRKAKPQREITVEQAAVEFGAFAESEKRCPKHDFQQVGGSTVFKCVRCGRVMSSREEASVRYRERNKRDRDPNEPCPRCKGGAGRDCKICHGAGVVQKAESVGDAVKPEANEANEANEPPNTLATTADSTGEIRDATLATTESVGE